MTYFTFLLLLVLVLTLYVIWKVSVGKSEPFSDIAWNTRITPINLFQETESRDTRYFNNKGICNDWTSPIKMDTKSEYVYNCADVKNQQNHQYLRPNYNADVFNPKTLGQSYQYANLGALFYAYVNIKNYFLDKNKYYYEYNSHIKLII